MKVLFQTLSRTDGQEWH